VLDFETHTLRREGAKLKMLDSPPDISHFAIQNDAGSGTRAGYRVPRHHISETALTSSALRWVVPSEPTTLGSTDDSSIRFERRGVVRGFRDCLPVALGVGAYGLVFGVLARRAGLSVLEAALMSATVLAGAAQLVAVELWTDPLPAAVILLTTAVVNLRYLLMGAALRPWFARLTTSQAYGSVFFLTDEDWALAMADLRSGAGRGAYLLGAGLALWTLWVAATVLGATAGGAVGDPARFGLDFALTAVFLTIAVSLWEGRSDVLPWTSAGLVAVAGATFLPGRWYIVLGAVAGAVAGVYARG
jgi:4-azaleucine resistance transporter AzlC